MHCPGDVDVHWSQLMDITFFKELSFEKQNQFNKLFLSSQSISSRYNYNIVITKVCQISPWDQIEKSQLRLCSSLALTLIMILVLAMISWKIASHLLENKLLS